MKNIFILSLTVIILSCSSNQPPKIKPVLINFIVKTDENSAVKDTKVFINGHSYGETDAKGILQTEIYQQEGQSAQLRVQCPKTDKYFPPDAQNIVIRHILKSGKSINSLDSFAPVNAIFYCIPKTKKHLVIIKTKKKGLPIMLMGKKITTTGESGIAQFPVEGMPGDEIEITIDTSHNPSYLPKMPSRRLKLPKISRFLVFEQTFTEIKPKRKRRKKIVHKGPVRL